MTDCTFCGGDEWVVAKMQKVQEVLDRFQLFHEYTLDDYQKAMGDIAEIIQ